ncbi:unnamed protein product [Porites evermanni]|uniref:Uncharacterized protein n=1 Tax=Porites evermanni TaxID=104178 RepID=A0ABN8QM39_9CNID|nr:unnamed protein product [Porites evermanni]
MGRGHSNLCEAHFLVLPDYCAKDQNLCLHYITSTNCDFYQGNMSWCYKVRGRNYHWVIDLYEMLNLLVIPAVIEALQKAAVDSMKEIEKGKTDHRKKTRIQMKVAPG